MQVRISPTLTANPILTLEDLGLERSVGLDQASRGLAERSEAQIVRWVQFPAGALFFTLVPEDPEIRASLSRALLRCREPPPADMWRTTSLARVAGRSRSME